jgi:RHS repeat-associated protein
VIEEYDGSDELLRFYVYGVGIDEPVAMYVNGDGWYYYHYDGLGPVIALSDSSGNIVEQCSYDIFGEPSCISDGNPYKFTGRRYDAETGLYYYRERYYSPELGRFLQPDRLYYNDSFNLYVYCWNNPLNWVDPWGLCKDDLSKGDIGLLVGGAIGGAIGSRGGVWTGAVGTIIGGILGHEIAVGGFDEVIKENARKGIIITPMRPYYPLFPLDGPYPPFQKKPKDSAMKTRGFTSGVGWSLNIPAPRNDE